MVSTQLATVNYPGGSIGKEKWGGAGFWFSAPKATTKDGKQTYYSGTTTLLAGARLRLEHRFVFPDWAEIDGAEPPGWNKNTAILRFPSVVNPTPENAITLSSSPSTVVLCTVTSAR